MTAATPAAELAAAVALLAPSSPAVAAHTVAVRIPPAAADAIARWLRETDAMHEQNRCDKHEDCALSGCQWCADEDWPCSDMRHALAVARAVLAGGAG